MEFSKLVYARRTVRRFKSEPVSKPALEKILHAGLAAPSPNNSTPWAISVVTSADVIKKMHKAVDDKLDKLFPKLKPEQKETLDKVKLFSSVFANAPVVLAVFSKPYTAPIYDLINDKEHAAEQVAEWRRHPELQATGAMVQNMLLAATEAGLGSCWISGALVARTELEKILGASGQHLETLVAIGHYETAPKAKEAVDLKKFVKYIE